MIVVHRRVRGIEILPKDLHFAFYDQLLGMVTILRRKRAGFWRKKFLAQVKIEKSNT